MLVAMFLITSLSMAPLRADEPVPVIFNTDMAGDCDDAGALAVLHAQADRGEAQILAVVTNRKCTAGVSGGACDAINTFYGRPNISGAWSFSVRYDVEHCRSGTKLIS